MEVAAIDKHSSLLGCRIDYNCKNFHSTDHLI